MAWAYGRAATADPAAGGYGWDELVRNALATLATVHPDHGDGVISADDVCDAWWTPPPYKCGVGGNFDTQILHQPAWELFAAGKLAGLEPTAAGWRIDPEVPGDRFSLRLPDVGIAVEPSLRRGYVRPLRGGSLTMQVRIPAGVDGRAVHAWAAGKPVAVRVADGWATFGLPTTGGRVADWAVSWTPSRAGRR
jgi:hypothetical protein